MTLYSTPEDKVILFVQGCNNVIIVRKIITIIIAIIFLTLMSIVSIPSKNNSVRANYSQPVLCGSSMGAVDGP